MSESVPKSQPVMRRRILESAVALGGLEVASAVPLARRAQAARPAMSFWQFYAPGGAVRSQAAWFETVVAAWNDAHDPRIELTYVPNDEYMNGSKLPTAFAAGHGPDIFIISPGDFLRYYNAGLLFDLTPYIDAATQADFPDAIIASRKVGGRIFGLPMEFEPMAMYYSIDAFTRAGLNESDLPQTWEQLLHLARKMTTRNRFGVLFETTPGYYQNFTWYPFLWQGGGDIQGTDDHPGLGSQAAIQALQFWQDCIKSGAAPRTPLGGGGWDILANLAAGYCAMQNCGIWAISSLASGAPGFGYGVFRLPTPPGGQYRTIGGGWAMVVNARGTNPDMAARFCAWAIASASPESVRRVLDWCTVAKSDLPPRNSALALGRDRFDQGIMKVFSKDISPGARAEPRTPRQVSKIVSNAIQSCQLDRQDPAAQGAAAARALTAFLASYKGAPIL